MIISTRSWLPDLDEVSLPLPATGYAAEALWSGGIAGAWRSSAAASVHRFDFRLGLQRPVGLIGLFDVRPGSGAVVTAIQVRIDAAWPMGTGSILGTITLGERRDGVLHLPVPATHEAWSIWVTLDTPAVLTLGEVWFGAATVLPRGYATRQDSIDYHQISTVSEGQTVRSAEIAEYTRRLSLGFDRLTAAELAAVRSAWHGARGRGQDVVVLPVDDEPTNPILGSLQQRLAYGVDFPVHTGLALDLVESGRALGA